MQRIRVEFMGGRSLLFGDYTKTVTPQVSVQSGYNRVPCFLITFETRFLADTNTDDKMPPVHAPCRVIYDEGGGRIIEQDCVFCDAYEHYGIWRVSVFVRLDTHSMQSC
jgi:hypothetical protein